MFGFGISFFVILLVFIEFSSHFFSPPAMLKIQHFVERSPGAMLYVNVVVFFTHKHTRPFQNLQYSTLSLLLLLLMLNVEKKAKNQN